jgi:plastocyanin
MADSNLTTSIAAVLSRAQTLIGGASASELADITDAIKKIKKTDDAAAEAAVNSRILTLYSGSTIDEKLKLTRALANMLETKFVDGVQFPDDSSSAGSVLKTNGMSTSWSKVSLTDMDALVGTPSDGDVLVYDETANKLSATPTAAAKFRAFADISAIPAQSTKGEIILVGSDFKFYYIKSATHNVTAVSGAYVVDTENNPALTFYRGSTYTFALDGSTTTGHPLYFTTDSGAGFVAGSYVGEYTSGVSNSRSTAGNVTITVPYDAPSTLYYQCGNHSAMVGTITVASPWVDVTAAN